MVISFTLNSMYSKRGCIVLAVSISCISLYSMESAPAQPIIERIKKAIKENNYRDVYDLIPDRDSRSALAQQFHNEFTPDTALLLCTYLKKAFEDKQYEFLDGILVTKTLPIAKLVALLLKRAHTPPLLKKVIKNVSFLDEETTALRSLATDIRYYPLFVFALTEARKGYFEDYYLDILEQALRAQWPHLVHYLLEKKTRNTSQVQELVQKYLLFYTKEALDESMAYVLLKYGEELDLATFTGIWSKLSRDGEPPQAQTVLDLVSLFTHQGINEYKANCLEYLRQHMNDDSLTIKDTSITWRTAPSIISSLKEWLTHCNTSTDNSSASPIYKTPINKRNDANQTMLMWAALFNQKEEAKQLLENSAHVNARDYKKRTALFYAARYASPTLISLLLSHKACVSLKDMQGKTPLDHALEMNNLENVILLLLALKEKDNNRCIKLNVPLLANDPLSDNLNLNALRDVWKPSP